MAFLIRWFTSAFSAFFAVIPLLIYLGTLSPSKGASTMPRQAQHACLDRHPEPHSPDDASII
jgi:hypothetical protein